MSNFVKCFAVLSAAVLVPIATADPSGGHLEKSAAACAALSRSLADYRNAIATQTGISEPAASSIFDDSDGMAVVRAKAGCVGE